MRTNNSLCMVKNGVETTRLLSTDGYGEGADFKDLRYMLDVDNAIWDTKKPIVVSFGGNLCSGHTDAKSLEVIAKTLTTHGKKEDVDLISIAYEDELTSAYGENPSVVYNSAYLMANLFAYPSLDPVTAELKPKAEIIENVKKITMFAHCAGTYFVNNIIDKYDSFLKDFGCEAKDRAEIMKEIRAVTYAPHRTVDERITSVNFCPYNEPLSEVQWDKAFRHMSGAEDTSPKGFLKDYIELARPSDVIRPLVDKHTVITAKEGNRLVVVFGAVSNKSLTSNAGDHSPKMLIIGSRTEFPEGIVVNPVAKGLYDTASKIISAPTNVDFMKYSKGQVQAFQKLYANENEQCSAE